MAIVCQIIPSDISKVYMIIFIETQDLILSNLQSNNQSENDAKPSNNTFENGISFPSLKKYRKLNYSDKFP